MLKSLLVPLSVNLLRNVGTRKARIQTMMLIPNILYGVGGLFVLIALHVYLERYHGGVFANMVFAVGFIIIGLLVKGYLTYRLKRIEQIRENNSLAENVIHEASSLTGLDAKSVNQTLNNIMQQHGRKVILGTAIAGLLLGKYGKNPWEK